MSNKKIVSALMALTMVASMTAISSSAEDEVSANDVEAPVAEETQAPEPAPTETQVTLNDVENWTEEAPASTEANIPATTVASESASETTTTLVPAQTTVPGSTTASEVQGTETTTQATATTTSTEKISTKLTAPVMGEFELSDEGSIQEAVIAWAPVEGAEGYQIYKTEIVEAEDDIPTSYAFDVKGTSYKAAFSLPACETIKVRAFKTVDGERVYGPWSEERTVYFNGMKPLETTTTAKATSSEKKSTTTTTSSSEKKTESPKTGDSTHLPALAGAAVSALLAGAAVRRKRK